MHLQNNSVFPLLKPKNRLLWGTVTIMSVLFLICSALTIPFLFESPSMFYKFGFKKLLLRTGKMIGILAGILIFLQLLLAGRLKIFDRIFSLPRLYTIHRTNAYVICLLAVVHPICVFIPDDLYMIPAESKYWPEWVGAVLLFFILLQTVTSRWSTLFKFSYPFWQLFHRIMGILTIIALAVHVLYVSESFEHDGVPHRAVFFITGGWILVWLWIRFRSSRMGQNACKVLEVSAAGKNACRVTLKPDIPEKFRYAPGQFIFVSFLSKHLSPEAHPFTISSSPSRPDILELTIRSSGDWTSGISALQAGDKASFQGPFGHFTYLLEPPDRDIVMIAGGIGITPMLSMLRHMKDIDDFREVTLIWSSRSEEHLFARHELDKMQQQLTQFKWIPIFTRKKGDIGHFGRLNRLFLEEQLKEIRRTSIVYVCGPPAMIKQVYKDLRELGVAAASIRQESFGF